MLLPNVTMRRHGNHIEIESIGMPHITVSQQASLCNTRWLCNDVEIEGIGTSHTIISQPAEQVRGVTGQQATLHAIDNEYERGVICRATHLDKVRDSCVRSATSWRQGNSMWRGKSTRIALKPPVEREVYRVGKHSSKAPY